MRRPHGRRAESSCKARERVPGHLCPGAHGWHEPRDEVARDAMVGRRRTHEHDLQPWGREWRPLQPRCHGSGGAEPPGQVPTGPRLSLRGGAAACGRLGRASLRRLPLRGAQQDHALWPRAWRRLLLVGRLFCRAHLHCHAGICGVGGGHHSASGVLDRAELPVCVGHRLLRDSGRHRRRRYLWRLIEPCGLLGHLNCQLCQLRDIPVATKLVPVHLVQHLRAGWGRFGCRSLLWNARQRVQEGGRHRILRTWVCLGWHPATKSHCILKGLCCCE
mmetsp:Transcript_67259/g.217085  ORF Transcript_67259/g.217085 Transcript_67259/m.217085 type:complete len:275 (-) Transcript_67259:18-842(-)